MLWSGVAEENLTYLKRKDEMVEDKKALGLKLDKLIKKLEDREKRTAFHISKVVHKYLRQHEVHMALNLIFILAEIEGKESESYPCLHSLSVTQM